MLHAYRVLWSLTALICAGFNAGAHAQQTSANVPYTPPVGNLEMPPVTPQQAEQYLNARQLPRTSAVPVGVGQSAAARRSLTKLNVEPVLGHDLPEGDTTPSGFRRADFATARPGATEAARKQRGQALGSGAAIGSRPPTAVIQEQPPQVGSP